MQPGQPKWRRRKEARPAEIVAAALEVFSEKGFAAARLDDIAARAGVSKGALYLYFETKHDLFRAVLHDAITPNIDAIEAAARTLDLPIGDLVRMMLARAAEVLADSPLGAVAKMVIAEARTFPDLARVWHDEVIDRALGIVTGLIEVAQARGEIRPGDSRLHAFSLISPLLVGMLWREVIVPAGGQPLDIRTLVAQHVENALHGMLVQGDRR